MHRPLLYHAVRLLFFSLVFWRLSFCIVSLSFSRSLRFVFDFSSFSLSLTHTGFFSLPHVTVLRSAPGAKAMSLMDIPTDKLITPEVTLDDFVKVMKTSKSSVSQADLKAQEDWTKEFGMEGA